MEVETIKESSSSIWKYALHGVKDVLHDYVYLINVFLFRFFLTKLFQSFSLKKNFCFFRNNG